MVINKEGAIELLNTLILAINKVPKNTLINFEVISQTDRVEVVKSRHDLGISDGFKECMNGDTNIEIKINIPNFK